MKVFKSIKDKYTAKDEFSVTVKFFILKIIPKKRVDGFKCLPPVLTPVF